MVSPTDFDGSELKEEFMQKNQGGWCKTSLAKVKENYVKNTENNPHKVLDINIKGTFNVLNSVKNSNVKKIIFASSSEVYGDRYKIDVTENLLPSPKSLYAHSKIIGEELIKKKVLSK